MNDGHWDHQGACSIWYDAQGFPRALIHQTGGGNLWRFRWINAGKPEVELGDSRDPALTRATQLIRESLIGKP